MNLLKIRASAFIVIAGTLILLEFFYSYRKRELTRVERWPSNILLVVIGSLIIRICFPVGLIGIAIWARNHHLGLFNFFTMSNFFSALFSFIVLDFAIYMQHVYSHKWGVLWKFHKVHHTDSDLDVTSALRFHPIEIIYSFIYKILIVVIIGANSTGILIFEIVLNSMAMFNHANIYIPFNLEKILRFFLVTPQMHIIHHSVEKIESDKNFGFNFSIWDYIFKTYQEKFISKGMVGQIGYNQAQEQTIIKLLLQPFDKIKG